MNTLAELHDMVAESRVAAIERSFGPIFVNLMAQSANPLENPMSTDQQIEQDIQAAGANVAPRITPADIEANITSEHYFTAAQGALGFACNKDWFDGLDGPFGEPGRERGALDLLTFCVLVLRNGFTVTGESACASPENFNAEIGRKVARANAVAKVWPLMGYELKCRLANTPPVAPAAGFRERLLIEKDQLDERLTKLGAFIDTPAFRALPGPEQSDLRSQHVSMQDYTFLLGRRLMRSAA